MRKSVKRRLSLKPPSKKKVRGIIISTEMILLLTAIIMFSVVAFFGISKAILSQATSQKQTLVIVRAEAWKISSGIVVSLYVQNTGSQTLNIERAGVKYVYGGRLYYCEQSFSSGWWGTQGIPVRPGEAKVVSFAIGPNPGTGYSGTCNYVQYVSASSSVYVYVKVRVGGTTWSPIYQEVGTAVKLNAP